MTRLKDRQRQIPFGFKFRQPETGWTSSAWASFDQIVQAIMRHRQGRPDLVTKHGWSTDYNVISEELDNFNAKLCHQFGWHDFIVTDEASPPKPLPPPTRLQVVRNVAAGAETLYAWLGKDGKPVSQELAESRAAICSDCPQNDSPGKDPVSLFAGEAADFIKRQVEKKNELKLATSRDGGLGECKACNCPLALKVWTPLVHIHAKIPEQVKSRLDARCWILHERPA